MHAKTAGRLIGFTWLTVAFVFANTTGPLAVTPASAVDAPRAVPQVPQYSEDAAVKAQEYLDRFYRHASFGGMRFPTVLVSWNGYLVRVEPIAFSDDGYSGRFRWGNTVGFKGLVIEFNKESVIDWEFRGPNRKTFGDFQTRSKLPSMSEGQAMRARGWLSASPVPAGW